MASSNIEKTINITQNSTKIKPVDQSLEASPQNTAIVSLDEVAIEAADIVSRLEQAAEGGTVPENDATAQTVFLGAEKRGANEIISIINGLINSEEDGEPGGLPPLDKVTKLVIVSHSLSAYCGGLEKSVIQKLSTRFTTDTARWLSNLCRFLDASATYHEDQLEGLIRVTKLMLHYKYPRYLHEGVMGLNASLPVIYSSICSPLGVVQQLCRNLGLPLACVRPVPVNTHFGSEFTMDVTALQKMLSEDVTNGRTPLICIADVGTPITGNVDNIARIKELCSAHNMWLHLRGHALAALMLSQQNVNTQFQVLPIADSYTLTLGHWLGIPGLPMVTLYKLNENIIHAQKKHANKENALPVLAGLHADHHGKKIISLPLWTAIQALGRDGVLNRLRDNFLTTEKIWNVLSVYKHLRILSPKPGGENHSVLDVFSKTSSIPLLFDSTSCNVVFQFTPDLKEGEISTKVPPYYDKLNSWLGQILQLDVPQVPIDICELENYGVVLRFCPFENSFYQQPLEDDIQTFIQCLEQQLVILSATIQHRETFHALVEESTVLKIVELPDWAGLGGVRYEPEGWEQLLTDQAKEELNHLNMALVESLRSTDSAFSLGEGSDGLLCVRFGMLTNQSDVEELLTLVIKVGQSVEENSRIFDSMSEIVKKGIETATLDLQKENDELLWQEGILRHVPVVGSFVNWWSPKSKETGVRGRSLNLQQGVVESTENIYKYHMQLQTGASTHGTKSPPTPQIQTPIAGSTHSRSSSHASSSHDTSLPGKIDETGQSEQNIKT